MELVFLCVDDCRLNNHDEAFYCGFKEIRILRAKDVDEIVLDKDNRYEVTSYRATGYTCIGGVRYLESKEVKTWEEAAKIALEMAKEELSKKVL